MVTRWVDFFIDMAAQPKLRNNITNPVRDCFEKLHHHRPQRAWKGISHFHSLLNRFQNIIQKCQFLEYSEARYIQKYKYHLQNRNKKMNENFHGSRGKLWMKTSLKRKTVGCMLACWFSTPLRIYALALPKTNPKNLWQQATKKPLRESTLARHYMI